MRRTEPEEARALLAVAAAVPAALVAARGPAWLAAAAGAPAALLDLLLSHGQVIAAAAAVALGVAAARAAVTRRTLRSRVRLLVVPTETLDPSPEAVVSLAAQLARSRRAVLGWLDARASAVRVLIRPDGDGMVGYELEVPARARPTLEAAVATYGEVELREPDDEQQDAATAAVAGPGGRRRVARAELVLARPSTEPLAQRGIDPDPLQSIAGVLAGLRADLDERAVVALDLLPVTPGKRGRLRRRMLRRARRRAGGGEQPTIGELLGGEPAGRRRRDPADLVERRAETRALQGKLGNPQPLFEMQLLVVAESKAAGRAKARLQALLSCFDAFAGENHLRASGVNLAGLAFLGSDLPGRRRRFDRRLCSGLFRPARESVVGADEVAGLLKPPTKRCQAVNVLRSGGLIAPPPPGLPEFTGERELIPLGQVGGAGGERLVGVRAADTVFSYMAGRSRYGKTETAIGQFVHLARSGHGGMFLDPHADAVAEIKTYLTDSEVAERVVEIDLADLAGRHGQPGWNLFDIHGRPPWAAAARVDAVVDAFATVLGWDERNTRALNLTTQAAQAMVELARTLPPQLAPTIFQIPTLLSDERWRATVLPHLAGPTRQFFTDRFPRLTPEAITPVTNVIDRLRASGPVAALLGNPRSTFDARRAMDRGQVVLACPGSGSTRDRLAANLLVYEVLHAAKGRADMPAAQRRPFWLFLDELQTYDGPNLPALLEQSAKYGGRAFLFNQNPERLSAPTLNAVTTNRSHLLTATVNAHAAGLLAREWGGEPDPVTITRLARYTYLAQVTLGDRAARPFLVRGVRARDLHAAARRPDCVGDLDTVIDRTGGRRPVEQVLADLDAHDQRIVDDLRDGRRSQADRADDESVGDRRRDTELPELPSARRPES